MSTPSWVQDAIFYQIFPDRFARSARMPDLGFEAWDSPPTTYGFKGGDLYGVLEKLDYLQDLGINAIYLNPVFASASNHRYHTYDYFNVDPLLGGNAALRELLDGMHGRKMHLILDGVFNHASRGFWQFNHVLETGAASPYKDWFHFDDERLSGQKPWGAYPSNTQQLALKHEDSRRAIGYSAWWNMPALPKFNTSAPAVRSFLFDAAAFWIEFGADGWRLDVPGEIDDDEFWREFRRRVRAANPEAYIVGEIWHEANRWLQGDQFDGVMNYLLTAAILSFAGRDHLNFEMVGQAGGIKDRVRPLPAHDFANELDRLMNLYPADITRAQLNLLDSHDMPRFLSCVNGDRDSLKLAWMLMFTLPGAPCIYYADEVGVDGAHDPDCRKGFPWDEARWDQELRASAKACARLRAEHAALRRGDYQRVFADADVVAYSRSFEGEQVFVIVNVSSETRSVEISLRDGAHVLLGTARLEGNRITLGRRSAVALK